MSTAAPSRKRAHLPDLTEKQALALLFLGEYKVRNERMPSRREISSALRLKRVDPEPVLVGLRRKGYVLVEKPQDGIRTRSRRNLQVTQLGLVWLSLNPISEQERAFLFTPPAPPPEQLVLLPTG